MNLFLRAAYDEAKKSADEGGIPIGAVLVIDNQIVGRGHNQRVQKGSAILHAEMDALESAGRLKAVDYQRATLYTTLFPCDMCSGVALLYKIPKIVVGENHHFFKSPDYLHQRGIEIEILKDQKCPRLMKKFIAEKPDLWCEDIGEDGAQLGCCA